MFELYYADEDPVLYFEELRRNKDGFALLNKGTPEKIEEVCDHLVAMEEEDEITYTELEKLCVNFNIKLKNKTAEYTQMVLWGKSAFMEFRNSKAFETFQMITDLTPGIDGYNEFRTNTSRHFDRLTLVVSQELYKGFIEKYL